MAFVTGGYRTWLTCLLVAYNVFTQVAPCSIRLSYIYRLETQAGASFAIVISFIDMCECMELADNEDDL